MSMTATETLRSLVRDSGKTLTEISRVAGVNYAPLWKWATGRQRGYDLDDANRVHFSLTGRVLLGSTRGDSQ